ncbi:MAG TPA: peptidyl-prolyl cis-trans isomerase [Nitrospirota bacterium]|nr:peptidyl-prolyl cis-trans isomerase [Nitrospirota bacterium]
MNVTRLTKYIAPVLFLGLILFSCKKKVEEKPAPGAAVSPDVKIVATVNGDPITLAEFLERFARAGFKPEQGVALEVKQDFLNRLIERKMMLGEAQRRRIKIGRNEIDKRIEVLRTETGNDVKEVLSEQGIDFEKWKSDIWEDMMVERLLAREVGRHVSVSSSEVKRYYQANPQEFQKPDQVHARQIVVSTEAEAQKVMEILQTGADFATVARTKSTAPEAEHGGDLGFFAMGDMPTEFNVVFNLSKGGISGIVKSPYGFHIFKLEDKRHAGTISLDEAYKEIAEKLRREKEDKQYKQWLQELRSRTKFEVNYKALEE